MKFLVYSPDARTRIEVYAQKCGMDFTLPEDELEKVEQIRGWWDGTGDIVDEWGHPYKLNGEYLDPVF